MQKIKPWLTEQDIVCAEEAAQPNGVVIFGASGDLTRRKLLGSLFALFERDLIGSGFYILGCGRKSLSDEEFRRIAQESIKGIFNEASAETVEAFVDNIYYISGDYSDGAYYGNIKGRVDELDKKHGTQGRRIFYLSVPPFLYTTIVEQLRIASLSCPDELGLRNRTKLVIEKPFGRDLQSALELDKVIHRCFEESQIYRIDHYLGKETVQNILMFRFADRSENILAFGKPGSGKTHLLCGICHELARQGRKVYFGTCDLMVQELLRAKQDLTLDKLLKKIGRYDVLMIDDFGYVKQNRDEMDVLFTLLAHRHERGSVLMSNFRSFDVLEFSQAVLGK